MNVVANKYSSKKSLSVKKERSYEVNDMMISR